MNIITTAAAAERLGVSPRRVRALQRRDDFPRPIARTANALFWDEAAIERWAKTADRSPGRRWPPKETK